MRHVMDWISQKKQMSLRLSYGVQKKCKNKTGWHYQSHYIRARSQVISSEAKFIYHSISKVNHERWIARDEFTLNYLHENIHTWLKDGWP